MTVKEEIIAATVGARARLNITELLAKIMIDIPFVSLSEDSVDVPWGDGDFPSLAAPTAALNAEAIRLVAGRLNALIYHLQIIGILSEPE